MHSQINRLACAFTDESLDLFVRTVCCSSGYLLKFTFLDIILSSKKNFLYSREYCVNNFYYRRIYMGKTGICIFILFEGKKFNQLRKRRPVTSILFKQRQKVNYQVNNLFRLKIKCCLLYDKSTSLSRALLMGNCFMKWKQGFYLPQRESAQHSIHLI